VFRILVGQIILKFNVRGLNNSGLLSTGHMKKEIYSRIDIPHVTYNTAPIICADA
jgi:hypothetical protein